jgi:Pyruvate/2-oxoacid:ferredoxin oxidoreductase gamma subunit
MKNDQGNPPIKVLWIRNDCHGYYTGQSYKDTKQPIPQEYLIDNPSSSPWFQKMDSDARLFRLLQKRFLKLHPEPIEFMQQHNFEDHTVLGLHIRAGNGESEHFVSANRVVLNETAFLQNVMELLGKFLQTMETSKPPLLFLATDTPTVIPVVQNAAQAWNIPVLTFPQPQLPPSTGVTYSAVRIGQPCLLSWRAMMADTILLSYADVLIAGMRSSFTQIMPMSMVLNGGSSIISSKIKHSTDIKVPSTSIRPRFCEVSTTGLTMTCVQDRQAWMARNSTNQWTLSTHSTIPPVGEQRIISTPVVHKMVVHFPDVDGDVEARMKKTLAFFYAPTANHGDSYMPWGDKLIDLKYRQRLKGAENVPVWTTV